MRSVYTGFFAKQIIGPESLDNYLLRAISDELESTIGVVCGEAVFDPSGTGVGLGITASADALNDRRLTITGDKQAVTDSGDMMTCGSTSAIRTYTSGSYTLSVHNPSWFVNVPYENQNAATYYVYVGQTKFPVDVGSARDGSRGYSVWADAPGVGFTPNSITLDGSGKIIVKVDAALTALGMQHWLTANSSNAWSYFAVVWLDTNQVGVTVQNDDPEISIGFARMILDSATGAWKIDLTTIGDGKLGQTVASTVAADYKCVILGPLITNSTALKTSAEYVFVGSVLSGGAETISTVGQLVTVPYASYVSGFAVDHNATPSSSNFGFHKQITAQVDDSINVKLNSASDRFFTIQNIGAGKGVLVVEDYAQIPEITQDLNMLIDLASNASNRTLTIRNSGTQTLTVYLDAEVVASKTTGGSGNFTANGFFYVDSNDIYEAKFIAESMFTYAFTSPAGAGALTYADGGGASVPYIFVNAGIGATKVMYVPVHNPRDFNLTAFRVHQWMSAAGTPNIRVALGRWDEGAVVITNITGWQACTTFSGAWATDTITLGGPVVMDHDSNRKNFLMIEITNNGIADNTARLHKVTLLGKVKFMPTFQQ
jgi:hypothetical protein